MIGSDVGKSKGTVPADVMIPEIAGSRVTAEVTARMPGNRNMAG
jgi:hypothetical protein